MHFAGKKTIGSYAMRDILVTAIILGSIPFILRRPWIGILMWTWIGMMSPHRLTWGFAYHQPFAMIIGLVTLVALLFSREPKRFPLMPATVALLLFCAWMTVTTIFALYPDQAWQQWYKVMTIQFFVLVTFMLMQNPQRIRWLIWVATASLAFYGVKGGFYTLRGGGSGMVLGPEGSFISGNTEIALAITMTIPLMYYLAMTTEKKWLKWGLGIGMVLCAIAVLGSHSRGGLLAVAGMGIFLWLKSRKKLQMGLMFILLVPALLAIMPETWFDKMHTITTYEEDTSAMGRINAWNFSFNLAKSRPLVGGGFQSFTPELFRILAPNPDDFHDSHSIWFEVLGHHGFVGLALFLLLWFLVWRLAAGIIRTGSKRKEMRWATELARMIQVSLIGFWVGGSFLGLSYFDLPYLLIALLVLTRTVMDRQLTKETQQSGPTNVNIARIRAVGTIGTAEFRTTPAITQNPESEARWLGRAQPDAFWLIRRRSAVSVQLQNFGDSSEVAMALTRDLRACCNPKRLLTGLLFSSLLVFGVAATAQEGNRDYYTAQSAKATIDLLATVEKYHLQLSYEKLSAKRYEAAFDDTKFILRYFPNHPKALMMLSAICNRWQSPDCNPDEWFEKAISRNPAVSETYVLYGIYLHRMKRFDAAVKNYKQALAIDPMSLNAHYNLGLAYVELKQYELANQQAQKSYALGAPFPGLREKLKRVGAWKPADAEAVPNNQGQSPAQK